MMPRALPIKHLPAINPTVEYDLAISFMTPHYILLDKVRAKKTLGWIHTDYTNIFINQEMELAMWNRLDKIASISDEVGNKFCEVFPTLKDKIIPIENILSSRFMKRRAEEFVPTEFGHRDDTINILSIGRYCYPKRFDQAGTIARIVVDELKKRGCTQNFKWYIIGYGSAEEEEKIRKNIQEEGMEEHVIMLGKRSNPYPYISACDVYFQPSRYEGKSITVREAQILGKPVIVANYPTAPSQVNHGVDGLIGPWETEDCATEVAKYLCDQAAQQKISDYLKDHDYGNEWEIEKIYNLIGV